MSNGFRVLRGFNALTTLRFLQAAAAVCFSLQALALSPMPQPISSGKFAPPPDWRPPVIALNNTSGQPIELRVQQRVDGLRPELGLDLRGVGEAFKELLLFI